MTSDKYPEFLPQWTKAVKYVMNLKSIKNKTDKEREKTQSITINKYNTKFGLDWFKGTCCLTGEAFFHEGINHWCAKCSNFTYEPTAITKSLDEFYLYKNKLAKHLQKKHPATWSKWEKL